MGQHRTYLGDSVYAEVENGMIRLCTWNGYGDGNIIFLEPEVLNSLFHFAKGMGWAPARTEAELAAQGELEDDQRRIDERDAARSRACVDGPTE